MASDDGSVWLTYNGAVTNFRGLRDEFDMERKRPLRTGSDTEVLIRLYEELGDCSSSGSRASSPSASMTAAARARSWCGIISACARSSIWSAAAGSISPPRSRRSWRSRAGTGVSTPRRSGISSPWPISRAAAPLSPRSASSRRGISWRSTCSAGRFTEKRYYELRHEADETLSEEAAAAEVRVRLRDAVERSLQVDVPVGLTLSGGFDTSTLLALAKELGASRRLHTFSIRINEASFDESRYQRIMVDFAKPIHHEVVVNPQDIMDCLTATVAHMDEPSGDGAAAPTFLLSREARKHVGVLLSGEGGDEVFYAYETYRAHRARQLYRRLAPAGAAALPAGTGRAPAGIQQEAELRLPLQALHRGCGAGGARGAFFWRHVLAEDEKARLLSCPPPQRPTVALFRELYDDLPFTGELDRLTAIDLCYYFVDDLMVKNDRSIMAHSVETRFPYMERDVVEFAARIPTRFKVKGLQGRCIQKLAMKDLLPRRSCGAATWD